MTRGLVKGSVKRTIMFWAGWALILSGTAIALPCGWWILKHGDLGGGAVAALTAGLGAIAGGANWAYRKAPVVGGPSDEK